MRAYPQIENFLADFMQTAKNQGVDPEYPDTLRQYANRLVAIAELEITREVRVAKALATFQASQDMDRQSEVEQYVAEHWQDFRREAVAAIEAY